MNIVCKEPDSFLDEKTIWIATLDNGETIYGDDDREGCDPPNAWLRLKQYCEENQYKITGMGLKFRSHHEWLPSEQAAYFFIRGHVAIMFGPQNSYYCMGYILKDDLDTVLTTKYMVPELIGYDSERRKTSDCQNCLIWNIDRNGQN